MLFRASSFVPPAAEAGLFTEAEKKRIGMWREDRFAKQVLITALDAAVLRSPTISLEMPDHRVHRFNGEARAATPGYFAWTETRTNAAPARAMPSNAAAAVPIGLFSRHSLELFSDDGRTHVLGRIALGDRRFQLRSINARYAALVEDGLNPASPPIDVEPPGPRPAHPAPNSEWPRGLLTEKLREALAKSSIGASLSPERCDQVTSCGTVTKFSCHPEMDGPVMFFDNASGALIMACGGSCQRGAGLPGSKLCTACPPPEWSNCKGAVAGASR